MAKIKDPETLVPEKPLLSIEEKESGEVLYTTLHCDFPDCPEVMKIAFSTLDEKGKSKKDKKEKIKKDYYDTLPAANMPDKSNPGNWYCDKHRNAT